ncbi:class I SAM-dependent methyltransferase [Nordella sp. HKS 07]|uniref:class I SAM-dependent methyltransferase n=1 Tax=Nordella sp. HKS 07 TaxID=2712222 RepID=UPI0013E13A8D|nr:class I SAM-dependent methyltransferase [Nordella sp. HKS 07]QIG51831.1 class I SAM-dependent methyltransferase [Nordella sp. HKS 07]
MRAETLPGSTAVSENPRSARCRICGASLQTTVVNLGMSPLCESFLKADQLNQMEPYFPLHVLVCDRCFLVQLQEYVSPESIFSEYAYFSSYSTSWVEHARAYCCMIQERLGLNSKSQVVELASNDGYLLQHFLPLNIPVLGIEPAANVAKVASAKGISTIVDFFGLTLARRLVDEGRSADLVVANNVLAQVPDLNDFIAGVAHLLAPDGAVTIEVPHLARLLEETQFDTIYHEHFSYFSLITLVHLAKQHGLRVFDVERLSTHGGSIRVYLTRVSSRHETSPSVDALLSYERRMELGKVATYSAFAPRVQQLKRDLLSLLIGCKNEGARICGYGAPGKGNTLLNYCGIGTEFIEFTVDRNPYKHGRYTPGMHIPIRPIAAIDTARPDYLIILPWNLRAEIIRQMRHVGSWGCKFILPIPRPRIVDPGALS